MARDIREMAVFLHALQVEPLKAAIVPSDSHAAQHGPHPALCPPLLQVCSVPLCLGRSVHWGWFNPLPGTTFCSKTLGTSRTLQGAMTWQELGFSLILFYITIDQLSSKLLGSCIPVFTSK